MLSMSQPPLDLLIICDATQDMHNVIRHIDGKISDLVLGASRMGCTLRMGAIAYRWAA